MKFVIEKNHHAQVLGHYLDLEQKKRNLWLDIHLIPRDTSVSKDNRIWGLQSWFKSAMIFFCDDIPCLPHIRDEATKFPKFRFKDFLDTMADQLQEEDGKIDDQATMHQPSIPDEDDPYYRYKMHLKFLGFNPTTKEPEWVGDQDGEEWNQYTSIFGSGVEESHRRSNSITGVLS